MVKKWQANCKRAVAAVQDFLDEKGLRTANNAPLSRLHKFAHFWLMVAKSFNRNRCPVRASALAYTTLLALIPILFVVISVSGVFLKETAEQERLNHFIDKMVAGFTPPSTAAAASGSNDHKTADDEIAPITTNLFSTNNSEVTETNNAIAQPNNAEAEGAPEHKPLSGRQELVRGINGFIRRIQSGRLGVTGVAILFVMAILMLNQVEGTFNDIWGVTRGRSWPARIIQYWAVITLGPALLAVAAGMTTEHHLEATRRRLESMGFVSTWLGYIVPVLLVCVVFTILYMLIPNTKVRWQAALAGGAVAGVLWHLNNFVSVFYVSRWITNSNIYGNLAVIPVLMAGLYFAWLILLFGAQVTYAYQNRAAYRMEKQTENISQRGKEFIALRLMECVGQRFQHHECPANVTQIADGLAVPTGLVQQILQTLLAARLVVEVTGRELAYAPARPLANITLHDILLALRAGQGQELATRDEPTRTEVYGEFARILEAEKRAAGSVTLLTMVNRTEKLLGASGGELTAVTDGKTG
jgi:membrane protein